MVALQRIPRGVSPDLTPSGPLLRRVASLLSASLFGRAGDCTAPNGNPCEVPADRDRVTWIVLGSIGAVLVIVLLGTLTYFHMRRVKRDKADAYKDHELADYGLDEVLAAKQKRSGAGSSRGGSSGGGSDGLGIVGNGGGGGGVHQPMRHPNVSSQHLVRGGSPPQSGGGGPLNNPFSDDAAYAGR